MGGYGYNAVTVAAEMTFLMVSRSVLCLGGKGRSSVSGANADPVEKLILVQSIGSLTEGTGPCYQGKWLCRN